MATSFTIRYLGEDQLAALQQETAQAKIEAQPKQPPQNGGSNVGNADSQSPNGN